MSVVHRISTSHPDSLPATGQLEVGFRDRLIRQYQKRSAEFRIFHAVITTGLLAAGIWWESAQPSAQDTARLMQFIAAVVAAFPSAAKMVFSLRSNVADAFTDQLVALAVLGALAGGEYFAAVLVPVIMDIGHFLEQRGIQGTQAAMDGLRRLMSGSAVILDGGVQKTVSVGEILQGQTLLIRPGDVLAADGLVTHGQSSLDEASITGESLPREVCAGDEVSAGTLNLTGVLHVRVTRTGMQTSLGKIRGLLAVAARSKAPITRLLERYAELYVPVVMLLAAIVFLQTHQLTRAIAVLVVSCPCALVLSGPAAMIASLATCVRHGILIRGTRFLESLADADTVVFDKTGTLTEGQLVIIRIVSIAESGERDVLQYAATCAQMSNHPVSRAVLREAEKAGLQRLGVPDSVQEHSGQGIEIRLNGEQIDMGKPDWHGDQPAVTSEALTHSGPIVGVWRNRKLLGWITFSDGLRHESQEVAESLRNLGIQRMVMLTGDRSSSALPIAESLQIDRVVSEALPQEKLAVVHEERRRGRRVIVVGDGINDALALAAGDIGIAMGARGSDIAIQSADIALMTNDLRKIPLAIRLSRRTQQVIHENIAVAVVTSAAMLIFGALGAFSAVTGAILHNLGTAIVIANSTRLLRSD